MENNKIVFPELFFTDKNLVGRDVLKISRNLSLPMRKLSNECPRISLPMKSAVFYPKKKELRADCTSALPICIRGKSAMST